MASALLITTDENPADESVASGGMGWMDDVTLVPQGQQAPGVLITGGFPISTQWLPLPVDPKNLLSILQGLDAQEAAAPVPIDPLVALTVLLVQNGVVTADAAATAVPASAAALQGDQSPLPPTPEPPPALT